MRLESPDGEPVIIAGRRERVLLAYLALAPDLKESRRNLIGLLWGDKADNTTLDNLRTCLWSLRKALGDQEHQLVLSEREWIRLDGDLLEVDLWRFNRLVEDGTVDALEEAADTMSGELLEGLDLDSEEFADWIRDERLRFSDLLVDALTRLMRAHERAGDIDSALAAGQRILRKDPFNEVALRAIMGLYAASGRRNLALQTYRGFADNLQQELGVEPEAETQETFNALAQSGGGASEAPDGPVQAQPQTPPPPRARPPAAAAAPSEASAQRRGPEAAPEPVQAQPAAVGRRSRGERLMAALRIPIWTFGGALTIAVIGVVVIGVIFWRVPALAPPWLSSSIITIKTEIEGTPPSIVVLPFRGHGDGDADAYAAAFSDAISTTLSKTSNMEVKSRSSAQIYEKNPPPAPVIAQQLGVRYLLEGSVTKFGDSVAVRVALIDTAEGEKTVPIGTYEKKTTDFFTLQGEVTLNVVTALRVRLTEGEEERISQDHGTKVFQAWLHASEGQKHLRKLTLVDNTRARRNYRAAINADPKYAGAWTGLAWTYLIEARFGWGRDRAGALKKSAEYAKKSLSLDNQRAATYALLGSVALFAGQFDLARKMGERAVELEYNDADSAALYALTLTYTGEPRKARNLTERAIRLRPYPPRWYTWLLARSHRLAGRPGVAVELLTKATEGAPKSIMPMVELAVAYSQMGAMIQGRAVAQEIMRVYPRFSSKNWLNTPAYEDPGDTARDLKALRDVGLPD